MSEKPKRLMNPKSLRNLNQYKDLTDDEFEEVIAISAEDDDTFEEFERKIKAKLQELEVDYDFSDMKINDLQSLRALAQALINLDDLEHEHYKIRTRGISLDTITLLDRMAKQMTDLRSDVSNLQNDLKITRKIRKGDGEESVLNYIENLKKKAQEFYEQKMSYVLCPNCGMLLATIWTQYPESKNKITLTCKRHLENDALCNTTFSVSTLELLNQRGTNRPELLPESML